ncbi:NAC domain-containing protein [Actinidia chinensis var. chinensis]|uniref:NAC domain-containing protein n=1 Tax=Actinidia chinensis var. chinensis TaxID=1590841 RepID=A0A2R6PH39_ACTCC|nr:NAC domain-containing protein [Actinidia chinensis var. chinensis]
MRAFGTFTFSVDSKVPRGVKFDPSDEEIIWHLIAKVGVRNMEPHPLIDEFISTVKEDDRICYTHPQHLPAIMAYNTGTRKGRKIQVVDFGDVLWHKTGRTKPVILDGAQQGCKKIMVLYVSPIKGGKAEKTNRVMHQYHLVTAKDEKEGEYVISKVFYKQQFKQTDKCEQDLPKGTDVIIPKVDPVTPKSVIPEPPRTERRFVSFDPGQESAISLTDPLSRQIKETETSIFSPFYPFKHNEMEHVEDKTEAPYDKPNYQDSLPEENLADPMGDNNDNQTGKIQNGGTDLEECQDLVLDPANLELDTTPDFRLSQLEFGSQESFLAWGGGKVVH